MTVRQNEEQDLIARLERATPDEREAMLATERLHAQWSPQRHDRERHARRAGVIRGWMEGQRDD